MIKKISTNEERMHFCATHTAEETMKRLNSEPRGLCAAAVEKNRQENGTNAIRQKKQTAPFKRLLSAFFNPFSAVLMILALISVVTDMIFPAFMMFGRNMNDFDCTSVIIITMMLMMSGTLRFVMEEKSGNATKKLLEMIQPSCTVIREGKEEEISMEELVTGDIIRLSNGDMIPADVRILSAKDLFLSQAQLTGESEPVEKTADTCKPCESVTAYTDLAFMGSNVLSGTAEAIVVNVGEETMFGSFASELSTESADNSFSDGLNAVSLVLIRFMAIMAPVVVFINGITKNDWLSALLFGISIAVGLTPEMLPMIVTSCLVKGAVAMGRKKTVIKNLNAIQNFGAIDILCTDKTGTLTENKVVLEHYLNVNGEEDTRVLRHAYLNSYFQTGYKNLMDLAIIHRCEEEEEKNPQLLDLSENYNKIDEIPFDFTRRRLTTVVQSKDGKRQMVTKGAVEEMLSICSFAECNGKAEPLSEDIRAQIKETVDQFSSQGFRVLALAQKSNPSSTQNFGVKDECDMVLLGFLTFLDPLKDTAEEAIDSLHKHGVGVKILTGDNEKVTLTVCRQLELETKNILLGTQMDQMNEEELCKAAEATDVFAKLTPDQKKRVVSALRKNGHVVGFMGDGINDATAMKAADIGISVDTAADIAKETADVILLEKDLTVLKEGILEGRKTYANMIKYIKITASSNFGNMFSVLAASSFLPFLPLTSLQLLLLNMIYDLTCTMIPWDNVDDSLLEKPRPWDASSIAPFMLWIGPISSLFDIATFLLLYFVICPMTVGGLLYTQLSDPQAQALFIAVFHAGWFVESMWSQTLVIHMIRTEKIPFLQSHASGKVMLMSFAGCAAGTIMTFTQFGDSLGFSVLPHIFFFWLILLITLYMFLVTRAKNKYVRKYGTLL